MLDDIMVPVQSTAWIQNDTYSLLRKDTVFKRQGAKIFHLFVYTFVCILKPAATCHLNIYNT